MRMRRLVALALVVAALAPRRSDAHATSTGLARLSVEGDKISYRLTLVLAELPEDARRVLAAAAAGDVASAERVATELRANVLLSADDAPCRPGRAAIQGSQLGEGRVELQLQLRCPTTPHRLSIHDAWWSVFGEHHRTIARVDATGAAVRELALSRESTDATVELATGTAQHGTGFFTLGLLHILTGIDHLLFLAALLLGGGRIRSLVKIVTAFTVAHSVTLALATLHAIVIPSRLVEPVIAASIIWVAVENIRLRNVPARRWVISFCFGLVHGFAFASALEGLDLPGWPLAHALLRFNLGVEAGQLVVLAGLVPFLIWIRRAAWEPLAVRTASVLLAATGSVWFVQRVLGG